MATLSESETPASSVPNIISQNLTPSSTSSETSKKKYPEYFWMVKPCYIYKDEYKDCKSFRARFHQYFIDGKSSECDHWKEDYDNCILWEQKDDTEALKKVVENEKERVRKRLRCHYANDVWEHRTEPPEDWNKDLPEPIRKGYEGSFLKMKAEELKSGKEKETNQGASDTLDSERTSSCSIV